MSKHQVFVLREYLIIFFYKNKIHPYNLQGNTITYKEIDPNTRKITTFSPFSYSIEMHDAKDFNFFLLLAIALKHMVCKVSETIEGTQNPSDPWTTIIWKKR